MMNRLSLLCLLGLVLLGKPIHAMKSANEPPISERRIAYIRGNGQAVFEIAQNFLNRPAADDATQNKNFLEAAKLFEQVSQYCADPHVRLCAYQELAHMAENNDIPPADIEADYWQPILTLLGNDPKTIGQAKRAIIGIDYIRYLHHVYPNDPSRAEQHCKKLAQENDPHVPAFCEFIRDIGITTQLAHLLCSTFGQHSSDAYLKIFCYETLALAAEATKRPWEEIDALWQKALALPIGPQYCHLRNNNYAQFLYRSGYKENALVMLQPTALQTEDYKAQAEALLSLGTFKACAYHGDNAQQAEKLFNKALAIPKEKLEEWDEVQKKGHLGMAMLAVTRHTYESLNEAIDRMVRTLQHSKPTDPDYKDLCNTVRREFDFDRTIFEDPERLTPQIRGQIILFRTIKLLKANGYTYEPSTAQTLKTLAENKELGPTLRQTALMELGIVNTRSSDPATQASGLSMLRKIIADPKHFEIKMKAQIAAGTDLLETAKTDADRRFAKACFDGIIKDTSSRSTHSWYHLMAAICLVDFWTAYPKEHVDAAHLRLLNGIVDNFPRSGEATDIEFLYGKALLSLAAFYTARTYSGRTNDAIKKLYEKAASINTLPGLAATARMKLALLNELEQQQHAQAPSPKPKKGRKKIEKPASPQSPVRSPLAQQLANVTEELPEPIEIIIPEAMPKPVARQTAPQNAAAEEFIEENNGWWEQEMLHQQLLSAVKAQRLDKIKELMGQGANPLYRISGKSIIDYAQSDASMALLVPEKADDAKKIIAQAIALTTRTQQPLRELTLSKDAVKQLAGMQEEKSIRTALEALEKGSGHIKHIKDPHLPFSHRLKVGQDIRIGFNPTATGLEVIAIGRRENFYKR